MDKASVSTVGIVGVSGYSGIELARIVAGHPRLALALAISDKWAGTTLGRPPGPVPAPAARWRSARRRRRRRRPSRGWTSSSCARRRRRRWRSRRSRWRRAPGSSTCRARFGSPRMNIHAGTGSPTPGPELLPAACYSMPEAGASGDIRAARLVSNPGCYATASTLAVLALLRGEIIARRGHHHRRRERHDRRRAQGERGLLVLGGGRRLPRLSRAAPPAHARRSSAPWRWRASRRSR